MLFETIGFTIDQLNGDNGGAGAIAIIALRRYLLSPIMPLGGGRHITARPNQPQAREADELGDSVACRRSLVNATPRASGHWRYETWKL